MSDHSDHVGHDHSGHSHDHKLSFGVATFFGLLGTLEVWAGWHYSNPAVVTNGSHNLSEILFPLSIAGAAWILLRVPLESHLKCQLPHYIAIGIQAINIIGIGFLAVMFAASHTNLTEMWVGVGDGVFGFALNWVAAGLFYRDSRRTKAPHASLMRATARHYRLDAVAGVVVAIGGFGAWFTGLGLVNRLAGLLILVITIVHSWPHLMESVRQIHSQAKHPSFPGPSS